MSEQEEFAARAADSTRLVVSVVNDSLLGHARHAADLGSRAADPNEAVDPLQELGRFWKRTIRDGARLFLAMWSMLESLAAETAATKPPVELPPASNPLTRTIGPVPPSGPYHPLDLRRRGDINPTIVAAQIAVRRSAGDPSQLELQIEAGGAPRGLYEGTVTVGSAAATASISYNIYVDW